MGKVSEFICEAFEDACKAEELHKAPGVKTAEDLNTIKELLKRAYIRLWNFYGDENRAALSCTIDVLDLTSTESSAYRYDMDNFYGLCLIHDILDMFNDYHNEYFST